MTNLNSFNLKKFLKSSLNKLFSDPRSGCRDQKSTLPGSGSATLPSTFRSSHCATGGSESEIFLEFLKNIISIENKDVLR